MNLNYLREREKKQSKLTGKKSGIKVFNNNIEFSFSVVLVFKQKKIQSIILVIQARKGKKKETLHKNLRKTHSPQI